MCGIAGYVNSNGVLSEKLVLKNMTDSIAHRGPDGEGFFLEGNVALGHRRLSIIDLSERGAQPMHSDNKSCLLYTSPSPRDKRQSRMPSSA